MYSNEEFIHLNDGKFHVPVNGAYYIEMTLHVRVTSVKTDLTEEEEPNQIGMAFCLHSKCNGDLRNT